jgi:hypothetical protein
MTASGSICTTVEALAPSARAQLGTKAVGTKQTEVLDPRQHRRHGDGGKSHRTKAQHRNPALDDASDHHHDADHEKNGSTDLLEDLVGVQHLFGMMQNGLLHS